MGHKGAVQNSKYPPAACRIAPSLMFSGNERVKTCNESQAASFSAGSEPTNSRIISHAARFRAPSGGGPIASDTAHCGQKQIRFAADFCRGRIPTVCANKYTATDLLPDSSSRLQRRQYRCSKSASGLLRHDRQATAVLPSVKPDSRCANLEKPIAESSCDLAIVDELVHPHAMRFEMSSLFQRANPEARPSERQQVAAVCFRILSTGVEFLLVRTRRNRWIF